MPRKCARTTNAPRRDAQAYAASCCRARKRMRRAGRRSENLQRPTVAQAQGDAERFKQVYAAILESAGSDSSSACTWTPCSRSIRIRRRCSSTARAATTCCICRSTSWSRQTRQRVAERCCRAGCRAVLPLAVGARAAAASREQRVPQPAAAAAASAPAAVATPAPARPPQRSDRTALARCVPLAHARRRRSIRSATS